MKLRIGNGYDVHKFCVGNHITLGGVKIAYEMGLEAHSDGDVLIHAICDALLGSLALADIGAHFPDTDPTYKGVDSRVLLERCCKEVRTRGYQIGNIDSTIMAEAPKLRPHIDAIRVELARVMGIDIADISVKATTTEGLGFVGRKEGIAVMSTVLVARTDVEDEAEFSSDHMAMD